ncbi:MAG: GNAT family N-acetyltransferase [Gammaproteobacteria bacterium]|nr:MAG: GNAT family N-acetyltransferase [Gammaproteobacteria bacterium]
MTETIHIERLEIGDAVGPTARFLASAFPAAPHLNSDYLRWLYFDNPAGSAIACNAMAGDQIVSHFAITPFRCELFGRQLMAGLALNVATDSGWRRQGLLARSGAAAIEAARAAGLSLLMAVTNRQSTHGFLSRLGFMSIAPLDARIGFGETPAPTPAPVEFRVLRDAARIQWRLARPGATYTVDTSARPPAIYAPSYRWPLAPVVELARCDANLLPPTLPRRRAGLRPRTWLGLDPGRHWPAWRYRTLPGRLRPAPLNLVFRSLAAGLAAPGRSGIHFEAFDFDAF